ncbi:carboxypeptidase-like regulatory domain-containing protein [Bernardetia sp. OM2101]|uniref:carboxypeptidase-like regulatory domain-containing protein n=1 Tax=Bernardetia sp. OM2101 TaxID=3344876 RepID=UPI0035CED2E5
MKKSIFFILLLFSISYSVFGQISVKGKVVDENGESLPNATIQIKGTERSTQTDISGNFEIEVKSHNDILIFSFVGFTPKEIKVFEVPSEIILETGELQIVYCGNVNMHHTPLKINYWSGLFYNPYGITISKGWHYLPILNSTYLSAGYSTNFQHNQDFYGRVGTEIFKRNIYYKFQQTTFEESGSKHNITTHLIESSSNIKIARLVYGLGYQKFTKVGLENGKKENYGVQLGLSKYLRFAKTSISAKSFYWQDYWAWEANLNKSIYYRKLRLNTAISYRQTTHHFKEINLTLGYIF